MRVLIITTTTWFIGAVLVVLAQQNINAESDSIAENRSVSLDSLPTISLNTEQLSKATNTTAVSIVTGEVKGRIDERLRAIRKLERNLSQKEIVRLFNFLKSHPDPLEENLAGLQALKNEIMNSLRDQIVAPKGLTRLLIAIYRDRPQDPVTRDYAIQHLVGWYEQGAVESSVEKQEASAVLSHAMQEHGSIAGTALLGLHRLSINHSEFDQQEISDNALNLAVSLETTTAVRITAFQVCSERGLKEVLPTLESIAQVDTAIALRISAIAALGNLGEKKSMELLQQFSTEEDETLKTATRAALKQLVQRQTFN